MKKRYLLFLMFFGLFVQITQAQNTSLALPKPIPERLMVDNAGVLTSEQSASIEHLLVSLDDSTSNQIVVLTVPTLNDNPIEDVAVSTFRAWGIGDKKKNNGILVLIAVQDHQVRIEVGYGLEGAIPDITAGDIIEKDIKPAFRAGDYYGGINAAVADLGKAAVGEYKVRRNKTNGAEGAGDILKFVFIVLVVIFILAIFRNRNKGDNDGNGNNRRGGGWFNTLMMLGLLDSLGGRNRDDDSWGGGGSDWGGGGGFGGFGGGSSGGGGASGGW